MFSNAQYSGTRRLSAGSYREVNASTAIEGASPHKLVSLLYGAASGEIAAARGAIARRDIAEKGRAIGHAVRIVEEGLLGPLDMEGGGAIAINLRDLYEYVVHRLTMANLNSDDDALAECARILETISTSWDAIGPQVDLPSRAAA
jgi:flagellar protein FliS